MPRFQYEPGIRASQLLEKYDFLDKPVVPWFEPDPNQPPLPQPEPLTRRQEIALLTLRKSDHALHVLGLLFKRGEKPAVRSEYESLVTLGLATRNRQGYHSTTPRGHSRARDVAHAIATELGITLASYRTAQWRGSQRVYGMSDSGNA